MQYMQDVQRVMQNVQAGMQTVQSMHPAQRFLNAPWRSEIDPVLERLGQAAGANRVSAFENFAGSSGELCAARRYRWVAGDGEGRQASAEGSTFSYGAGFTGWVEKLRAGVRRDLENELKYSQARAIRGQIVRGLLERVVFELPESAVAHETRNVVYDLVRENSQRGVKREMIEQQKDQIYAAATHNAKERVKLAFLIQRIAEQEKITVSQEEVVKHAQSLAAMYQMPFEQFLKDLQKRNGVNELYDQIAHEKVLTFLEQNAKIEDVPAK